MKTLDKTLESMRNSIKEKLKVSNPRYDGGSNNREDNPTPSTSQTTQPQPVRSSQVNVSSDTMELSGNQQPGRANSNQYQQPEPSPSLVSPPPPPPPPPPPLPTALEMISRAMGQRRLAINGNPDQSEPPNNSDWDES